MGVRLASLRGIREDVAQRHEELRVEKEFEARTGWVLPGVTRVRLLTKRRSRPTKQGRDILQHSAELARTGTPPHRRSSPDATPPCCARS